MTSDNESRANRTCIRIVRAARRSARAGGSHSCRARIRLPDDLARIVFGDGLGVGAGRLSCWIVAAGVVVSIHASLRLSATRPPGAGRGLDMRLASLVSYWTAGLDLDMRRARVLLDQRGAGSVTAWPTDLPDPPRRTCSSTPTTPSSGGSGGVRRWRRRSGSTSRSCCPSGTPAATGAIWRIALGNRAGNRRQC